MYITNSIKNFVLVTEDIKMNNKSERKDILDTDDLTILITDFYKKAVADSIVGFFFTDIANINLDEHIPKIVSFWDMQLFGRRNFKGNPYLTHKLLNDQATLTKHHFHRWVFLFHQSIDELYVGSNANILKRNSLAIADKMSYALYTDHPSTAQASHSKIYQP